MQQLTGLDELYLSLDTDHTNGHIGGLAIFPTREQPRDELAFITERLTERLPRLPLLRWRLKPVPMRIDHQYWVDGPIQLKDHIGRVRLAKPGTPKQLQTQVQVLMNPRMPRDRPMWRLWVIEGLQGGGYAYLLKLSHGKVDGAMLWSVLDQLSDEPSETLPEIPASDAVPGRPEMLARGVLGTLARPLKGALFTADVARWAVGQTRKEGAHAGARALARILPGELAKPAGWVANRTRGSDEPQVAPLLPTLRPPMSPLNGVVTERLTVEYLDIAIADLRAVGKLVDGTINDAALALGAGTARRYMQTHGGVPDEPLIVSTPISFRTGQEKQRWANQVFMLFQPVGTHLADPMARLRFSREASTIAKATWDGIPSHLLRRASTFIPTPTMRPVARILTRLPGHVVPRTFNYALSNVKGPRVSPTYGGASIERYIVFGFLSPGIGLLFGGQSLGDRMVLCATVCQDIIRDHDQLPRMMQESLDELLALVPGRARTPSG